jgi:hypothetical protein
VLLGPRPAADSAQFIAKLCALIALSTGLGGWDGDAEVVSDGAGDVCICGAQVDGLAALPAVSNIGCIGLVEVLPGLLTLKFKLAVPDGWAWLFHGFFVESVPR